MYCGYITTIKELRKHSNADRLQCAEIFTNNVIVDMSYHVGQRVIYFPTDGQLSEEYAKDNNLVKNYVPVSEFSEEEIQGKQIFNKDGVDCINVGGYMDPKKRNITALKLRGEMSDGLVMPVETLAKYTDISKLNDGDQITVLNGHEICRKYIPSKRPRQRTGGNGKYANKKELREKRISYPFFLEHIDTQQLAYNQNAFKPGDVCCITLKMHGTSARTANTVQVQKKKRNLILKKVFHLGDKEIKSFQYISGTRRTTLRDYDGGFYGDNAFRKKWHDFFKDKLPKGICCYYEIVGYCNGDKTIMGRCSNSLVRDKAFKKQYGDETVFSYGCDVGENDAYIYRMTMTNEDGFVVEVPWDEVQVLADMMGAKCVPTFERFIFTTWEDLIERVEKYYDGADPIGKTHVREGVVVRIENRPKFTAYKHKNDSFKILEGIIKDNADEPDMEEAEDLIVEDAEE